MDVLFLGWVILTFVCITAIAVKVVFIIFLIGEIAHDEAKKRGLR